MVEHPKSKSTQPNCLSRWTSLYVCRNVFSRRVACAGYLVSQYDFHFGDDFVFVDYPCQRQISRCCELSYRLPEEGHGKDKGGMCSQCSSASAMAKGVKRRESDDDEGEFHDHRGNTTTSNQTQFHSIAGHRLFEPKVVVKQEHYEGNNGIAAAEESDVGGGNDYAWSPLGEPADWELEEERPPRKRRKRRQRYSLKEDFIDDDDDDIENEGCPREKRKRSDGVPEHWKGDAEIRCDFCPAMVSERTVQMRNERDQSIHQSIQQVEWRLIIYEFLR